jgi:hypothetical protein
VRLRGQLPVLLTYSFSFVETNVDNPVIIDQVELPEFAFDTLSSHLIQCYETSASDCDKYPSNVYICASSALAVNNKIGSFLVLIGSGHRLQVS